VQIRDIRIGGQRPRQGVLAATGTEEENSHGVSLPAPAHRRRCPEAQLSSAPDERAPDKRAPD
jgi:hypothetical protein